MPKKSTKLLSQSPDCSQSFSVTDNLDIQRTMSTIHTDSVQDNSNLLAQDVNSASLSTARNAATSMCLAFQRSVKESTVNVVLPNPASFSFTQGATFEVILPMDIPKSEEDFRGLDYSFLPMYVVQPVAPGRATAPYEFARGSKKTKDQLQELNKKGLPLTDWSSSKQNEIRFWTCEKKGYNRGNRNEAVTWTYGGGDVLKMSMESKDIAPFVNDQGDERASLFYLDAKLPGPDDLKAFDVVRVTLMPKTQDSIKKGANDKKTCFALKSVGSCPGNKSIASVLHHLTKTMPKSLDAAQERAKKIVSEGTLPYAHQVDCTPPKDDRDNHKESTIGTTAFLVSNIGSSSTFLYNQTSKVVRIYTKPNKGGTFSSDEMCVEVPVHSLLKNANARDIKSAIGLYVLAAASGGLHCFTMHNSYWSKNLWDAESGFEDPTPFRGSLIIDASKLFASVCMQQERLIISSSSAQEVVTATKKVLHLDASFFPDMKIMVDPNDDGDDADVGAEDEMEVSAANKMEECNIQAEVGLLPRVIKSASSESAPSSSNRFSYDMRLAPHGSIHMDSAYVVTFYVMMKSSGVEKRRNIYNLNYNAVYNIVSSAAAGPGSLSSGACKRHTWSHAIPSVLDDDDEELDQGVELDGGQAKRIKLAMDSVASQST